MSPHSSLHKNQPPALTDGRMGFSATHRHLPPRRLVQMLALRTPTALPPPDVIQQPQFQPPATAWQPPPPLSLLPSQAHPWAPAPSCHPRPPLARGLGGMGGGGGDGAPSPSLSPSSACTRHEGARSHVHQLCAICRVGLPHVLSKKGGCGSPSPKGMSWAALSPPPNVSRGARARGLCGSPPAPRSLRTLSRYARLGVWSMPHDPRGTGPERGTAGGRGVGGHPAAPPQNGAPPREDRGPGRRCGGGRVLPRSGAGTTAGPSAPPPPLHRFASSPPIPTPL